MARAVEITVSAQVDAIDVRLNHIINLKGTSTTELHDTIALGRRAAIALLQRGEEEAVGSITQSMDEVVVIVTTLSTLCF